MNISRISSRGDLNFLMKLKYSTRFNFLDFVCFNISSYETSQFYDMSLKKSENSWIQISKELGQKALFLSEKEKSK